MELTVTVEANSSSLVKESSVDELIFPIEVKVIAKVPLDVSNDNCGLSMTFSFIIKAWLSVVCGISAPVTLDSSSSSGIATGGCGQEEEEKVEESLP